MFCTHFITRSIQYYLEVTYDYQTERKAPVYGSYRYTNAGLVSTLEAVHWELALAMSIITLTHYAYLKVTGHRDKHLK